MNIKHKRLAYLRVAANTVLFCIVLLITACGTEKYSKKDDCREKGFDYSPTGAMCIPKTGDDKSGDGFDPLNISIKSDILFSLNPIGNDNEVVRVNHRATIDDHLIGPLDNKADPGNMCANFPNAKTVHIGVVTGTTELTLHVKGGFNTFSLLMFESSDGTLPSDRNDPPSDVDFSDFTYLSTYAFGANPARTNTELNLAINDLQPGSYTRINVWGYTVNPLQTLFDSVNTDADRLAHPAIQLVYTIIIHGLAIHLEQANIVRVKRNNALPQFPNLPLRFPELYEAGNNIFETGLNAIYREAMIEFRVTKVSALNSGYDLNQDGLLSTVYRQESEELKSLYEDLINAGNIHIPGVVASVEGFAQYLQLARPLRNSDIFVTLAYDNCGLPGDTRWTVFDPVGNQHKSILPAISNDTGEVKCNIINLPGNQKAASVELRNPADLDNTIEALNNVYFHIAGYAKTIGNNSFIILSEKKQYEDTSTRNDYVMTAAHEIGHAYFKLMHSKTGWPGTLKRPYVPGLPLEAVMAPSMNKDQNDLSYFGNHCVELPYLSQTQINNMFVKPAAEQIYHITQNNNGEKVAYQQAWIHMRHNRSLPYPDDNKKGERNIIFQDNFDQDHGWQINPNRQDSATTGQWEVANAESTRMQLAGAQLVTGALAGSYTGHHDIDGGLTSAQSPTIDLHSNDNGTIQLSFQYYFAHAGNSTPDDYFRITIIGQHSSRVLLEQHGNSMHVAPAWTSVTEDISDFKQQSIYLLVEAADHGSGSLVEAAVDAIAIEQ